MGLNLCDTCCADYRHERNSHEIVVRCGAYKSPMTNADRIRAMSNEELAEFLYHFWSGDAAEHTCFGCKAEPYCAPEHTGMIDWLRQSAEEGSE